MSQPAIGGLLAGYLDDVCSIFDRHNHPIILVEQCAMLWMGIAGSPTEYDFLVRDSQLDDIVSAFIASGEWEHAEQDQLPRSNDSHVNQVLRLHRSTREPIHIRLWPEKLYFLSVDGPKVQVPNVVSWDCVLMEEYFDPEIGYPLTKTALEARNTRILPRNLAQRENSSPLFIPTISRMIDALLDQERYRQEHGKIVFGDNKEIINGNVLANRPAEHITSFVKCLYLERPQQRAKLLPHISSHNLSTMEARLARFRRRPTIVLDSLPGILPQPGSRNSH
ncbi:hypothetical protein RJZ56_000232 [Blastomyces dermatitidis]|uniref:Uncharacterized protein n=3 Tax=Blastomyces TaxID=229219 RepID=A0A179UYS7_BLAGS|nr:uncharacterized protein BDBG_07630 [Blastomyces gilchristii SLH14081]XP_045276474.1 uncharacterized protein BDCG_04704 [Blastomyces dermatitidis ER-3]EGE85755.1 hypothetical protein BDDG_08700 [Blastomyces dermatitidis ATCC 18188]EQL34813.1 hypothetical protein BDFG_03504 [Blastomyces dermatitidis ATCC 26199]EEQ89584.1 hypothetical protein BDCG_04704 [Blastomyces dermatitidis ER-3]OAT12257.1 hypothetical protein BDBG_07630 [Blastomyces gilchristii SLH14081]